MIAEHAAAFLALLDGDNTTPPLVVFHGAVPKDTPVIAPPYVVVYFADTDPEEPDSRALDGTPGRFVQRAYVHSVGENALAALAVADRVRARVLNVVPNIVGRSCFPIRREDGQPVLRDEGTGPPVMDKADVYRLESEPAAPA